MTFQTRTALGPLLATVGIASLLAGCGTPTALDGAHEVRSATILLASEPTGVNPLISGGNRATQDLIDRLFLHLFEEQPDFAEHPPTFAPRLAREWTWSSDHLTLNLTLRQGVLWSDGVEVTAEDVRWTWQVQRDKRVAWRYAELKEHIVDIRVLGSHRLEVEFDQRSPNQLADLNEGNILPRHAWGRLPLAEWPSNADWFRRHLVTNGPFKLESWESQQELVLTANPDYYEPGLPILRRVALRIVPLRRNRIEELAARRADFIPQVTPDEAQRLEGASGVIVQHFWHRQYDYLAWNTHRVPFTSSVVRRALTQAIDRQGLVDALWYGRARVGTTAIPANVWAHHPRLEPWRYDPAAARADLASAGWALDSDGRPTTGGKPLSFELLVNAGNPIHLDAAVLIRDHLARIGILVTVRQLDFHALVDRLDSGDFEAAVGSWGIDTSLDLGYAFHSTSLTEGYNSGGYAEPRVDQLIEAARGETNIELRRQTLYELQELLHRDQPYTFLWEPQRSDAHSTRLENVRPNPLSSLFRLRQWRLAAD